MSQHPILRAIDESYLRADVPDFRSGDSVRVHTMIKEGDKERVQVFDHLDLDDDSLIDEDVQPVAARKRDALVAHWHGDLTSERQSAQAQLMAEALFIRRFEEARTKTPVNFDRCADDLGRN